MINSRINSKRTNSVPRPKIENSEPTHTLPSMVAPTQQTSTISIWKGRELKNLYTVSITNELTVFKTALISVAKDRECEICWNKLGRRARQVVMSSRICDDNTAPSTTMHDHDEIIQTRLRSRRSSPQLRNLVVLKFFFSFSFFPPGFTSIYNLPGYDRPSY